MPERHFKTAYALQRENFSFSEIYALANIREKFSFMDPSTDRADQRTSSSMLSLEEKGKLSSIQPFYPFVEFTDDNDQMKRLYLEKRAHNPLLSIDRVDPTDLNA